MRVSKQCELQSVVSTCTRACAKTYLGAGWHRWLLKRNAKALGAHGRGSWVICKQKCTTETKVVVVVVMVGSYGGGGRRSGRGVD